MRKIVIAPRESFLNYFSLFRKDNIFNDPKFLSKEDLRKERYFSYSDDALIYLIRTRKYEYKLAKKYLEAISSFISYRGNDPKILEIVNLQKELIDKGLLIHNSYLDYELDNSEIYSGYYSKEDIEIKSLIKDRPLKYIDNKGPIETICNHFSTSGDELFYVFNEIARLISSGVPAKSINIYGLKQSDILTILRLRDHYKLHINNLDDKYLIDEPIVRDYLSNYEEENNLENIIEKYTGDPNLDLFTDIIDRFSIDELDKDQQLQLYIDVFKSKKAVRTIYKDAVNHIKKPIVKDGDYLFIVNFVQGLYPTIIKDDGILDDKDNIALGLMSVESLNYDNNEFFKNCLNQHAHIYLSYASRNSEGPLYVSPIKKELNLVFNESPISKELYSQLESNIQSTYHHDLYKDYLIDSELFRAYKHLVDIPYNSYSNKYSGVDHYKVKTVLELSYTALKSFYQCKFKYYLGYVLKIDELEPTYQIQVGKLSHYILQHMDEGKSFDELYEEAKDKYTSEFDAKEMFLLDNRKEHFKKAFEYIKEQESHIVNPITKREAHFKVTLDERTIFQGDIDKYVVFGDNHEYVFVVDYKSGAEEFKENLIQHGLSLQLPTYALLLSSDEKTKDKTIAGLFIQKTYNKSANNYSEDDPKYYDNLRLTGVFLDSYKAMSKMDDSLPMNNTSKYIASCALKADDGSGNRVFMAKGNRHKSTEWFESIINTARDLTLSASRQILNNEFDINPKYLNGQNVSCAYCPYKDICFKSLKDTKFISNEGDDHE